MKDWKQIIFSLVLAVLLTTFVFAAFDAFYVSPEYGDFCEPILTKDALTDEEIQQQAEEADRCFERYNDARDVYTFIRFTVSSLLGLMLTIIGLYVPAKSKFKSAASAGLLLAGLFTLFIGTVMGWSSIATALRPFIVLFEIVIVTAVAWKHIDKPKRKK